MIWPEYDLIKTLTGGFEPEIGIVLGSGLQSVAKSMNVEHTVAFASIPGFPVPTAPGHLGSFLFGTIAGRKVCIAEGRLHYYEGFTMEQVVAPVRVMARLGAKMLFVTNAAGAVNTSYRIGDIMVITDHINLMPNPLMGAEALKYGERFVDMSQPYDNKLNMTAMLCAVHMGIAIKSGVYMGVTGPSYETAAENRFFRIAGADAVGMSTTPEAIAAVQMGLKVLGLAVITGLPRDAAPGAAADAREVIAKADEASARLSDLIVEIINSL